MDDNNFGNVKNIPLKEAKELRRARDDGFQDGLETGRREILDWLQAAYLSEDAPDRGTPEAQAILTLAQDAVNHFTPRVGNRGKKKGKAKR